MLQSIQELRAYIGPVSASTSPDLYETERKQSRLPGEREFPQLLLFTFEESAWHARSFETFHAGDNGHSKCDWVRG